jgi:hypothetical protein
MQQILEELESVRHIAVMADTSNHKNLMSVPHLQYCTPEKRVLHKVTEFHNLNGRMADMLITFTINVLYKYKLSKKYCLLWRQL